MGLHPKAVKGICGCFFAVQTCIAVVEKELHIFFFISYYFIVEIIFNIYTAFLSIKKSLRVLNTHSFWAKYTIFISFWVNVSYFCIKY